MKVPVTFREKMLRKSTIERGKKRGDASQEDSPPPAKVAKSRVEGDWRALTCHEKDLLQLIAERLLKEKDMLQWRSAGIDKAPWGNMGETIFLVAYVERGLALLSSDFFCGLLDFFKINFYHLTPNSVLHISIFVHPCEAFLGIRPHFNLFHHLFHLKPQPNADNPSLVRGAGLQLRNKEVYLKYTTPTSLSRWHVQWFYVENHVPGLPPRSNFPP